MANTDPIKAVASAFDPKAEANYDIVRRDAQREADALDPNAQGRKQKKSDQQQPNDPQDQTATLDHPLSERRLPPDSFESAQGPRLSGTGEPISADGTVPGYSAPGLDLITRPLEKQQTEDETSDTPPQETPAPSEPEASEEASPQPDQPPLVSAKPDASSPATDERSPASEPSPAAKAGESSEWQQRFKQRFAPAMVTINRSLEQLLHWHETRQQAQWGTDYPTAQLAPLWQALHHATLLGGKRFRPVLLMESARAVGLPEAEVMGLACAVECIHAQSLVFDDLPALDNDTLRRGQPTVHAAFGEATAILVGDALACLAFGAIAQWGPEQRVRSEQALAALELVRQLSDVASLQGLVNGQQADLANTATLQDSACPEEGDGWSQLRYIHANKTTALIRYSVRAPGILAGLPGEAIHRLDQVGACLGELFQVVDDLLDVTGTVEQLGKTPGKDQAGAKLTMASLLGLEAARQHARDLVQQADTHLDELARLVPGDVEGLRFLCHYGFWRLH